MAVKITRRELKELCRNLNAERLEYNGRPCADIYTYDNALYYREQAERKAGAGGCARGIAYSAGAYGNIGRLDYLETSGKFVCWY